jgi:hypothetical protein
MNGWTWGKCCDAAIKVAIRMNVSISKNADTVKRWYHNFRAKRRFAFPIKQHNLPSFLELNPDICSVLKTCACLNLNILSIEMMVEYLHHAILPEMVREKKKQRSKTATIYLIRFERLRGMHIIIISLWVQYQIGNLTFINIVSLSF